jgi:hypothetical protein
VPGENRRLSDDVAMQQTRQRARRIMTNGGWLPSYTRRAQGTRLQFVENLRAK